eukprot:3653014-Pyramimonas_sp.AAC.1
MRPSRVLCVGNYDGVVAAGAPAVADSATRGICISVACTVHVGFGQTYGGAAGCPADAAGAPAEAAAPVIAAVTRFSSSW